MRFQLPRCAHYRTRVRADLWGKQRIVTDATMNNLIIGLMAIYSVGDPHLQHLSWPGDLKIYAVAAALSLTSMRWIASQIDG